MEHAKSYNTKQKEYILSYLKKHKDVYLTADEILYGLNNKEEVVSRATLYRYLDCLVEQSIVKKILFQNETKASYQYIESTCKKYILKCTSCGKIVNTDCSDLENVCRHLQENHNFLIDEANITLYGECQDCQKKEDNHHEED